MTGHHFSSLFGDDEARPRPAPVKERRIQVYLKPIAEDENLNTLNKNSRKYRLLTQKRMCFTCPKLATQTLRYEMEGCVKIERYCDHCALKFVKI